MVLQKVRVGAYELCEVSLKAKGFELSCHDVYVNIILRNVVKLVLCGNTCLDIHSLVNICCFPQEEWIIYQLVEH